MLNYPAVRPDGKSDFPDFSIDSRKIRSQKARVQVSSSQLSTLQFCAAYRLYVALHFPFFSCLQKQVTGKWGALWIIYTLLLPSELLHTAEVWGCSAGMHLRLPSLQQFKYCVAWLVAKTRTMRFIACVCFLH